MPERRHEVDEVRIGAVVAFAATLVLVVGGTILGTRLGLGREPAAAGPPAAIDLPPPPRLQVDAPRDLALERDAERAELESYAWIDRDRGIVRIPIDRAIDLLARRGLPARKETR